MKNMNQILAIGLTVILLAGCAQNAMKEERSMEMREKALQDSIIASDQKAISSTTAVANKDTARKFIRTADIKFKVKNVRSATFRIEDIVSSFDGFVTYTSLVSNVDRRMIIPVSADSSLECTYYTVENNITMRIPNSKLDTALKSMAALIDYLDFRLIKADDITLSLLANKLTGKRIAIYQERLKNAIDDRGKKLNETTNAEENLLNKQEISDNAKIGNLSTEDKVSYSTVSLNIYQRQSLKTELIGNEKNVEAYKPGFFHQLKDAVIEGWRVFEYIFLFLVQIWGVLLIMAVVYFLVIRFLKRKKHL